MPCFPVEEMKIGHLFVENIDLFCSCVTGKQSCLRFNYHSLVGGFFVCFLTLSYMH